MHSNRVNSLVLDHNGHQSVLCWIQTHTLRLHTDVRPLATTLDSATDNLC